MTPTQRMESAYRANPDIGRYRLADEAGVGEKTARLFLERQRYGSQYYMQPIPIIKGQMIYGGRKIMG